MPKTKLAQRLRGPTYKWFGGIVGSHLSLMGMDQMDLPGRSARYRMAEEPACHKILDLLTEDIRGDKKWQKSKQEHN